MNFKEMERKIEKAKENSKTQETKSQGKPLTTKEVDEIIWKRIDLGTW